MKRVIKSRTKKKQQPVKDENEIRVFIGTFFKAFIIIMIILTPIMAAVSDIIDLNPGGDDIPVLEDDFDYLIPSDNPFFEAYANANRVNILALGVNENEGLTDTIMLVSFEIDNKHIDLIWVPRDTYSYRGEGYTSRAHHKINAAYRKNPVNSAVAVSELLMNIPINYYAVLSYEGVANIVESMGGVPMDVPFHMKYDDPYDKPPLHVDIPKGQQIIDGEHAIQFLRFRHGNDGYPGYPDEDLGRIKAQQQFMKNAFKKCLSFDLPNIATTAFNNIKSDITLGTVLKLTGKAVGISADDITTYQVSGEWDGYFVQPDHEKITEMLMEIYSIGAETDEDDSESPETENSN